MIGYLKLPVYAKRVLFGHERSEGSLRHLENKKGLKAPLSKNS